MGKNRVLLINPPVKQLYLPLGLLSLAAYLKGEFEVEVLDVTLADIGQEDFRSRYLQGELKEKGISVVGISASTLQITHAYRMAGWIKEAYPGINVVLGGVHVTFRPEEALSQLGVDFVVCGEGEETFRELLRELNKPKGKRNFSRILGLAWKKETHIVVNPERPLLPAEKIPTPRRDGLYIKDPNAVKALGVIMTSRGCPEQCVFCSSPALWRRQIRRRALAEVLTEIAEIQEEHKLRFFNVADDLFTTDRQYVLDFCRALKGRNLYFTIFSKANWIEEEMLRALKEAGCVVINYGVESGSQRILDAIGKRQTVADIRRAFALTQKVGIMANALFILGHPYETEADLQATYNLAKELKAASVTAYPLQPLPGSAVREELSHTGTLLAKNWQDYFLWDSPVFVPHGLTVEMIIGYRKKILKLATGPMGTLRRAVSMARHLNISDLQNSMRGTNLILLAGALTSYSRWVS